MSITLDSSWEEGLRPGACPVCAEEFFVILGAVIVYMADRETGELIETDYCLRCGTWLLRVFLQGDGGPNSGWL